MKIKGFMTLSILVLLLFPLISAVEFNLNQNFSQGETLITKVSGNFVTQITKDNVFFYQGHVRIPIQDDVAKIDNDYYIYALLEGKAPGNYSISIQNVQYYKGSEIVSDNLARNFTITNKTADFSLNPGFVTSTRDFSIELQNLADSQITINVKTQTANASERDISISGSKTASFSLKSGEIKTLTFNVGDGLPTFQTVELSSSNLTYEIPVYISAASQPAQTLKLEPSQMLLSIPTNTITKRTIYLYNIGSTSISNISLSLSDEIKPFANLTSYHIDNLAANSNVPIDLYFFSPGETDLNGNLKANINSQTFLYSQISLKFLNNYIPANESQQSYTTEKCADIPGVVCSSGQSCDKETVYAKDNVCCLGNCTATQRSSPWTGRIIAIFIVLVLVIAGVWFYRKKFSKAKKPLDLLKIAKGK